MADQNVVYTADQLHRFCTAALMAVGVPERDAAITADTMVQADLRGVSSHGVVRLPAYVKRLEAGVVNARPSVSVVRETVAAALVDGDNGLGQVVAYRAMELAIEKARQAGTGTVGVRGSNHSGASAYYAMMALPHDMIGIVYTSGAANIMAPWGGITPLLGNNPIAYAIPADKELPVVLDMACSVVARGRILVALKKGEKIPPTWALNKYGEPTTDPQEAHDGLVQPIGGYKGYGLALVVGVLSAVLTGSAFGRQVTDFYNDLVNPQNVGHLLQAVAIDAFMPADAFRRRMGEVIQEIKSSELARGVDRIYLPGEIEFLTHAERSRNGIPISLPIARELQALGERLRIEPLPG